jgi:hypothetical protein
MQAKIGDCGGSECKEMSKRRWILLLVLWFGGYVAALEFLRPQFTLLQISVAAGFILLFLLVINLKNPN